MNGSKHFAFFVVSMVFILLFNATWVSPVDASNSETAAPNTVDGEIRNVIREYFELRYRAFNTLQLEGIDDLISDQPDAWAFADAELDKLAVEIKHTEINRLRFLDYEFFLDFKDISINDTAQTATVVVSVRHDVIHEISMELDPSNPIVSHLYNLEHTIFLRQEQDQWKIVSDDYVDYLWRMLKQSVIPSDDILRNMEAASLPMLRSESIQAEFSCDLPVDGSTHAYYREGAVQYALDHIAIYNLNYPNYDTDPRFGDCTNFVSQALYEGGNVSMAFCDPNGLYCSSGADGNLGWFLESDNFRASAWTHVGKFHEFVLDPIADQQYGWTEGPEGCEIKKENIGQVALGDVIQYEWGNNNGVWDHAVIVVDILNGIPYIASHSEDVGPVPYTYFSYQNIRGIHIERSDGYGTGPTPTPIPTLPPAQNVSISISQNNDDAGTNPSPCDFSATDPEVYLGACSNGGNITSGFRFNAVQIPRGANIENAYITFTVDGTYTLPVKVELYGEATGNSATFTTTNPPAKRLTTNSSTLWDITDTWKVGDRRNTPNFSSVIQEIVNQADWNSGNSLSIILNNVDSGTLHRRVIAFERASAHPDFDPAELVVTYTLGSAPSATPTSVTPSPPTPTPVPTTAIPPTATPKPWYCFCNLFCPKPSRLLASEPAIFGTPTPMPANSPYRSLVQQAVEISELTTLLYRVEVEIMSKSVEGQRLTTLYYDYAPNIAGLLLVDEDLFDQGGRVLMSFVPGLQAILDGNGDTVIITDEQVIEAQAFLDVLLDKGDTDLRNVISTELEHHPLASMIGITMDEALTYTNGYQLTWRPPLSVANPYIAQSGRTIPVEFTLTDFQDNFAFDVSVKLQVVDNAGNIVVDPVVLGSNPTNGILVQGMKYHYNLQTKGLKVGIYTLQVFYNSVVPNEPTTWTIQIKGK